MMIRATQKAVVIRYRVKDKHYSSDTGYDEHTILPGASFQIDDFAWDVVDMGYSGEMDDQSN